MSVHSAASLSRDRKRGRPRKFGKITIIDKIGICFAYLYFIISLLCDVMWIPTYFSILFASPCVPASTTFQWMRSTDAKHHCWNVEGRALRTWARSLVVECRQGWPLIRLRGEVSLRGMIEPLPPSGWALLFAIYRIESVLGVREPKQNSSWAVSKSKFIVFQFKNVPDSLTSRKTFRFWSDNLMLLSDCLEAYTLEIKLEECLDIEACEGL